MDKLELDLDDLEVDSFQTNSEKESQQGTVQGNGHSCHSCEITCEDTCRYTCWYQCTANPCIRR